MRLYLETIQNDGDPAHINYPIAREGFRHFVNRHKKKAHPLYGDEPVCYNAY